MSKRPENPYKGHPVLGVRPTEPSLRKAELKIMAALCEFHGISELKKDPAASGWELAMCLAQLFVPAFRPLSSRGRPRKHSLRSMAWAFMRAGHLQAETGLSSDAATIEKLAEDQKFWQGMGFGETKKEVERTLRYILTDRINQPEIAPRIQQELQEMAHEGIIRLRH